MTRIHFLEKRQTAGGCILTPLPGQTTGRGEGVRQGLRVTPAKGQESRIRRTLKAYGEGTVFATTTLRRTTRGFGTQYECSDLRVLTEAPSREDEAPSEEMTAEWSRFSEQQ